MPFIFLSVFLEGCSARRVRRRLKPHENPSEDGKGRRPTPSAAEEWQAPGKMGEAPKCFGFTPAKKEERIFRRVKPQRWSQRSASAKRTKEEKDAAYPLDRSAPGPWGFAVRTLARTFWVLWEVGDGRLERGSSGARAVHARSLGARAEFFSAPPSYTLTPQSSRVHHFWVTAPTFRSSIWRPTF